MDGYSIAPDRIYMKKKYMFTGVSGTKTGKISIDIVAAPKNFEKNFNFYLLVVEKEVMDKLQRKHIQMRV